MKKTKTVFEGVINGQVFNNVKEYNKVLCELLDKGESVDAQTSTRTVPVEIEYDEEIEMLPGFEVTNDDDCEVTSDYDYIDDYIKDTQEETTAAINELKEQLGDKLERILYKIDNMDYNKLTRYDEDVCEVLNTIKEDFEYINNSNKILTVWKEFYESISNAIYDKLEVKKESEKIVTNDEEFRAKQLENELVNAVTKLIEQAEQTSIVQNLINSLKLK